MGGYSASIRVINCILGVISLLWGGYSQQNYDYEKDDEVVSLLWGLFSEIESLLRPFVSRFLVVGVILRLLLILCVKSKLLPRYGGYSLRAQQE